jgi:hypothetical protein
VRWSSASDFRAGGSDSHATKTTAATTTTDAAQIFLNPHLELPDYKKPQFCLICGSTVSVELKRAYDKPSAKDGARVLVDRLWPRGIKKSDARIQAWLRDLAPSTEA